MQKYIAKYIDVFPYLRKEGGHFCYSHMYSFWAGYEAVRRDLSMSSTKWCHAHKKDYYTDKMWINPKLLHASQFQVLHSVHNTPCVVMFDCRLTSTTGSCYSTDITPLFWDTLSLNNNGYTALTSAWIHVLHQLRSPTCQNQVNA